MDERANNYTEKTGKDLEFGFTVKFTGPNISGEVVIPVDPDQVRWIAEQWPEWTGYSRAGLVNIIKTNIENHITHIEVQTNWKEGEPIEVPSKPAPPRVSMLLGTGMAPAPKKKPNGSAE